jgi:hypothetical protein
MYTEIVHRCMSLRCVIIHFDICVLDGPEKFEGSGFPNFSTEDSAIFF